MKIETIFKRINCACYLFQGNVLCENVRINYHNLLICLLSSQFPLIFFSQHEIDRHMETHNGRNNGMQASSYPGSFRRRRGSWWQRVIQFVSPPALDTVPSPGVSPLHDDDNSSSPFSSSQSLYPDSPNPSAPSVRSRHRYIVGRGR